jgi:mRNA interferase RelE/StbE
VAAPRYTLEFAPAALRQMAKLDSFIGRKVLSDIEKLLENPRPQGVEKLETTEKLYRFRVGPGKNYRVVYQVQDEKLIVFVVKVGDRKEVYRHLK